MKLLRRDLKPGDIFSYHGDSYVYWVNIPGQPQPSVAHGTSYTEMLQNDQLLSDVVRLAHVGMIDDKPTDSPVDPAHYKALTPEPIDAIEGWGLNKDYHLASVVAYIARAGKKTGTTELDDLKKAARFLSRAIATREGRRAWE